MAASLIGWWLLLRNVKERACGDQVPGGLFTGRVVAERLLYYLHAREVRAEANVAPPPFYSHSIAA